MILKFALKKDMVWCLLYEPATALWFNIWDFYWSKKLIHTYTVSAELHKDW